MLAKFRYLLEGYIITFLPTTLKYHPAPQDTYEPNDTLNEATPISEGLTYTTYIWGNNDVDWFRFNVNVPVGKERLDEQIVFVAIETEPYYLQVYPYQSSSQTDSYRLRVEIGVPVVPRK